MNPGLPRSLLVAIAIISATALAYEVLLMRLFSIIQWHHFAYMIISLALLGYGISGVFLALNRERLQRFFPVVIMANTLLFNFSIPASFLIAQQIPFNPAEILWASVQLLYLGCLYLLLALPFFFAANVIGLSYYHYQSRIASVYSADLIGAGIGSAAVILLLFVLFPEKILMVLAGFGIVAALIVFNYSFPGSYQKSKQWLVGIMVIGAVVILSWTDGVNLNISPYKSEIQLLRIPGTEVVERYSSPLGLLSVVKSNVTPWRHAPGMSLNSSFEPPEQLAVMTDADNMTVINRYESNPEAIAYLDQSTSALPYHLQDLPNILILGAGTGSDILLAKYHQINYIDAVELNPQVTDLVKHHHAAFAGHIYADPKVFLHIDEARNYVVSTRRAYDLINISLLDAFGASSAGLYALSESYLYTDQAIQSYLQHLNSGGYLCITRWVKMPPRDSLKLLATVVNVFKNLNINHPEQRLVLIRGWQTATLLVKNGAFSESEIHALKQFTNARSFDLAYYPGIAAHEVNRYNILQQPYYYLAATALLGKQRDSFIDDYKFNIEPATDDRPYFFHFFKWKTLPEIVSLFGRGGISLLESGYLILAAALVQAVLAGFLLIMLPLGFCKKRLGIKSGSRFHVRALTYFFCLGLAFLFIEIAFIQKFILILHHPLYAVTAVLCTFLLSAGIGSRFAEKFTGVFFKSPIGVTVLCIALISTIYIINFETLTGLLLEISSVNRVIFSIVLIALLGFFMGMPFPLGLSELSRTSPELIPLAWGINGYASVVSAILATLLAMQFGFTVLIFLAVLLYGIAGLTYPKSG